MDLSKYTVPQLTQLQTQIRAELVRRAAGAICLGDNERVPRGGAILKDRPAIGGDRNTDTWYPTIEAANAALAAMAGNLKVNDRGNGAMMLDYTVRGCQDSLAWTEIGALD